MRKNHMTGAEKRLVFCVILALAVLLILMAMTIAMNSAASGTLYSDPPFSLSELTSGTEQEKQSESAGDYVVPAFIGIAPLPEGTGISAGGHVIRELYALLAPCLSDGLMTFPAEESRESWEAALESSRCIYIRYHSALPVVALQGNAAALCGGAEGVEAPYVQPVKEMVLLLPDKENRDCRILLLDAEGKVWQYLCSGRREYPVLQDVVDFADGFDNSFFRVTLRSGESSVTEPVFLERVQVRNMLLTTGTVVMMQENQSNHFKQFLRKFDFNPDKLNTHEEADGTQVTVSSHGRFRMLFDRMTYTAGADGGILLENFVGYRESYSAMDALRAACSMISALRSMHYYYIAGDGEVILTEMTVEEEQLRLVFRYTFDNLLLEECDPAMVVIVEDDRIMLADIYTVVCRSMGEIGSCFLETGVYARLEDDTETITDVTLTYPVDFQSNSIYPVWTVYRKE